MSGIVGIVNGGSPEKICALTGVCLVLAITNGPRMPVELGPFLGARHAAH